MAKAHVMTPARRAALKKAQLASAKKRKRKAVVRNVGRGAIGSKRGSRKTKYRLIRAGAGLAAAGAVAYGAHKYSQSRSKDYKYKGKKKVHYSSSRGFHRSYFPPAGGIQSQYHAAARTRMHRSKSRSASGPATRHNRIFVTNSHGKTSVRKRTH